MRIAGDIAALKGVMKLVLEAHDEAMRRGVEPVLDLGFIAEHTHGFDEFAADLRATGWDEHCARAGCRSISWNASPRST